MGNRSKIELKLAILIGCLLLAFGWWISRLVLFSVPVPELLANPTSSALKTRAQPPTPLTPASPIFSNAPLAQASLSSVPAVAISSALSNSAVDPTAGMPVLQITEMPDPIRTNLIKRIRIVRANFKYPLWRVEEVVQKSPSDGSETIKSRNIMIADHVMIRLNRDSEREKLEALTKAEGLSIRKAMKMPGSYLISIPDETADALPRLLVLLGKDTGFIRYVEPDYVVRSQQTTPNDSQFSLLWGLNNVSTPAADISAPQIWDMTTGDSQLIIGGIDSGIDYNHPDLASNIWHNTAETINGLDDDGNGYVDDVTGWNFVSNNNAPMDDHGHGTHTAGTIGAVGNNGIGVVGVNWHCKLMPLKFLDNTGSGVISDATEALHYVADLRRRGVNIRITNNSWGGGGTSAIFQEALAEDSSLGILFMAAAGNDTNNNDITPSYPASYDDSNLLAIAATDSQDNRAVFSNYGSNTVHLAAPGVNTYSTLYGSRYGYMSGTSMATPHVAGVAALLWSLWPTARAADIRDAILKGVDVIPSLTGKTVTGGRLNARGAVNALFRIIHTPNGEAFNSGSGYPINVEVGPSVLTDTHQVFLFWTRNGSTHFNSVPCEPVSNACFRATIPEQAESTLIHYWLQAASTNGLLTRLPANAPSNTFDLLVVPSMSLTVTGSTSFVANTSPNYGEHLFCSGTVLQASAPAATVPTNGTRWACTGWVGTGSIPSSGTSNAFTFTLATNSTLSWQWQAEVALTHTSVYSALNTTSWWAEGSMATSLLAPSSVTIGTVPYRFTGWNLDGLRQPDAISPAVNPIADIPMSAPHLATALFIPEARDSDGNGIQDWWELRFLGSIATDPVANPDGDGFNNLSEFKDQTDPTDPSSFPRPPVIIHTPLDCQQPRPAPYTVSALITDNCQVASAVIRWSRNGGQEKVISMTVGSNHLYTATLPAPGTNGDYFVYSIMASDLESSTTNGPHTVIPSYPEVKFSPSRYNCLILPETSSNLTMTVTNSGVGAWHGNASVLWGGFNNDVEEGALGWVHSGSSDLWNVLTDWSFSGSKSWYCGNPYTYYYTSLMHAKLDSTPFYVTAGAQLTFWQWIECELDFQYWRPGWIPDKCWDGGIVEISTNNGASFKQLTPLGGYPYKISGYVSSPWPEGTPCFAGEGNSWSQPTFDLSAYAGSVAILRFHFGSDENTEETGWLIDDIVVSPYVPPQPWLTAGTNLVTAPHSNTAVPLLTLNSTGIPTGDRHAVLQISDNAITNSRTFVPIQLSVRSPANLIWSSAKQTSTNGEGLITFSHRLSDADGDRCLATFEWSTAPDGLWSNISLISVQAEVGQALLTGIPSLPLSNLVSRSEAGLITNTVISVWDSKAVGTPIVYSSNTSVRARTWDGIFWSNWVTSQPFMVDNEAPPPPTQFLSLVHRTHSWSKNPLMSLRWDYVQESRGSGVTNYQYGVTTNLTAFNLFDTTSGRADVSPALSDGTNYWGWVRSRDQMGNLSIPALFGPCWIDIIPPSPTHAVITFNSSPFGRYVVDSNAVTGEWSGFSDGAGSGILGYYFAPTNAGGTTKGTWTTTPQGILSNLQMDRTNSLYVWAKDQTGWIGAATHASLVALSLNGDWDHDGANNSQEEISGTDALQAESVFQLGAGGNDPLIPGSFTLHWSGLAHRHYTISYKDSLSGGVGWIDLPYATSIEGTNGLMSYTDSTFSHPSRFYRISVTPP